MINKTIKGVVCLSNISGFFSHVKIMQTITPDFFLLNFDASEVKDCVNFAIIDIILNKRLFSMTN